MIKTVTRNESVLVLMGGSKIAPIVFSCEHASGDLPDGWSWPSHDHRLINTHWAVDLGAKAFTEELVAFVGAVGIIAQTSRLVIDLNRPTNAPTLFRQMAEHQLIELNRVVDPTSAAERIRRFYQPYHAEMNRWIANTPGASVFSIHSYTPCYEGAIRTVEVGVLFDDNEQEATELSAFLAQAGYATALNQPWSGKGGLMFSPLSHARRHGRSSLELEVRNDLLSNAQWRARFMPLFIEGLRVIGFLPR